MQTRKDVAATKHLSNSRFVFMRLLEVSRNLDEKKMQELIANRYYEEPERLIIENL